MTDEELRLVRRAFEEEAYAAAQHSSVRACRQRLRVRIVALVALVSIVAIEVLAAIGANPRAI